MTNAQKKGAPPHRAPLNHRDSRENQRGTKPPAAAVSPEARPAANFDARTVRSADASNRHGSRPFTWRNLCDAAADPVALGSVEGKKPSEVKAGKLRAFCRPCVDRVRKKGVASLGYLVVDIDGGDFDAAERALKRAKLRALLYTTASHQLPGKPGDRFRVVVPVRAPQGDPAIIDGATCWLVAGVLGLSVDAVDSCSFDTSHLMYLPGVFDENREHYSHEVLRGKPADTAEFAVMAALIGYEPPKPSKTHAAEFADVDRAVVIAAMTADPFAAWVQEKVGVTPIKLSGNFVAIKCPWRGEHTDGNETAYFIPRTGDRHAVFKCHHEHCAGRKLLDLQIWARGEECPHVALRMDSLYFMADAAKFVDIETMHVYPGAGVDVLVPQSQWPWVMVDGERLTVKPSIALKENERERWFDTQVYDPDEPTIIKDRMVVANADCYASHPGARMLNTYVKPDTFEGGDAGKAGMWRTLVKGLYGSEPAEVRHALQWMASAARYPGVKINHALVLCGAQGIGKDSILFPVEALIGHANIRSIGADAVFSEFNSYRAGVMLKVNEIRPTDSHTLTALYEKLKPTIAAPPTMLDINEKHIPRRHTRNLVKVVMTTNHPDALHVPEDDRRLFVLDTDTRPGWKSETWFLRYYRWCAEGGIAHVKAYLDTIDLSGFDPNAPPPRTRAWKACVENRRAVGGDDACAVALDVLTEANKGNPPDVVFGSDLTRAVQCADDDDHTTGTRLMTLRRRPTAVRKLMLEHGYSDMPNPNNRRGLWTYTRRGDRKKVTLGAAWVREGVSAAAVDRECRKRQQNPN